MTSIKAWSDQDEKQLIFFYTEDDLKEVPIRIFKRKKNQLQVYFDF